MNQTMEITVLVDNNTLIDNYLQGEPALSFLIKADNCKILFDTGYSDLFLKNAKLLNENISDIDYLVLSHGHDDHTKGLKYLFKEKISSKINLVAHPDILYPKKENNDLNIGVEYNRTELENQLSDIEKAINDIDYREANQKAGYVYVISNIGAFGPDVYKIGMTRRLDPQERVDELGDASVPFNFDVHAMIFSDDAPALEAALHKAFEDRKLNMVNTRREFFNVTLDEIKEVVKRNFDKTVEFIDIPDAEQYRISQKLKNK